MLKLAASALLIAAVACAGHSSGGCDPVSPDVVAFVGRPVYQACQVTQSAKVPKSLSQAASTNYAHCGKATVEVVVDTDGTPLMPSARVLQMSDTAYLHEVLGVLTVARFTPATIKNQRVAQLVTVRQTTESSNRAKVPFVVRRIDGPLPPPAEPAMPTQGRC